jgi:hypothetical protein
MVTNAMLRRRANALLFHGGVVRPAGRLSAR